jgi:Fibronectin type III domain
MRPPGRRAGWFSASVGLASLLCLVLAGSVSAAHPKAGKLYSGHTPGAYHEFSPPVSFTVSHNGRQLLGFKWAGGGCIGLGGPGNPYADRDLNYKVGTIRVASNGSFSVNRVKWTSPVIKPGQPARKIVWSTVKGRFKTATTATGTIYFTMKITKSCTSKVTFTATMGGATGAFRKGGPGNGTTVKTTSSTLTWSASRNATRYEYCVTKTDTEPDKCSGRWVSSNRKTRATVKGLTPGGSYYWQVRASSSHGSVAADRGSWYAFTVAGGVPKPQAGFWLATSASLSGPHSSAWVDVTSVYFNVAPSQATVSAFGFAYDYSAPIIPPSGNCSGSSSSAESAPAPITGGQFQTPSPTGPWTGSGSGTFNGTFDSATTAHGTATFGAFISGPGCAFSGNSNTGTFTWIAAWQPS